MKISESVQEIVAGYFCGELSNEQVGELLNWVEQSEENLHYFRELGEIWHLSGILTERQIDTASAFKRIRSDIRVNGYREFPGRELHVKLTTLIKIAAAIVILVGLGIVGRQMFNKPFELPSSSSIVETFAPRGSKSVIKLTDGTTIWLNADTRLKYSVLYGTDNRDVYLNGEAYFKVAKDEKKPFKVFTSDVTVTALGTTFNVKAYEDEGTIETTLEEGSVRIDPLQNKTGKKATPVILNEKQNAIYYKTLPKNNTDIEELPEQNIASESEEILSNIPVRVAKVVDIRPYTSWKDAKWIFKNETLSMLAPKLERRFNIKIVFMDDELREYAFTGTLKEELPEKVLEAVRLTAPIRYEINENQVKLYVDENLKKKYNITFNPN